jgi:hypothetical protein
MHVLGCKCGKKKVQSDPKCWAKVQTGMSIDGDNESAHPEDVTQYASCESFRLVKHLNHLVEGVAHRVNIVNS